MQGSRTARDAAMLRTAAFDPPTAGPEPVPAVGCPTGPGGLSRSIYKSACARLTRVACGCVRLTLVACGGVGLT